VQQLNELKAQSLNLPQEKAQLDVLGKQIPDNPALPTLIRSLTAAGKKVGVTVVSMKPGTPVSVAVPVPVPVAAPATTTGSTDAAGTGGTTAAAGTTAPTVVAPPAAPKLFLVPLSLDITGSYFEVEQFINKLEGMQRKFLLTGFTLKPGGSSATQTGATTTAGELDLNLTGQVFLSPTMAAATTTPAPASATTPAQ
jgi:Tfp pilus assembly protein PilO